MFSIPVSVLGVDEKGSLFETTARTITLNRHGARIQVSRPLKPGQTSGVVPVGANNIVFQAVSHTPADESTFAAQQEQIRQQVLDQKKGFVWEVYRQNLTKQLQHDGKLKINQEALKLFVSSYNQS